jgi:formylglycine-generating enzyme required for sulfatase activity
MDKELGIKINSLLFSENMDDTKEGFKILKENPDLFDIALGLIYIDICNSKELKKDYSIAKFCITQNIWEYIMGNNPATYKGGNIPVDNFTMDDVNIFLKKINEYNPDRERRPLRLPTMKEWSYAAEGGQNMDKDADGNPIPDKYPGFNKVDEATEYGWFKENSNEIAHPVGQLKPNRLGIYDMAGGSYEIVRENDDDKVIYEVDCYKQNNRDEKN